MSVFSRQPPALLLPTSVTRVPSTAMAFWSVRNPLAFWVSALKPGMVGRRSVYSRVLEPKLFICEPVRTPDRSALTVCRATVLDSTLTVSPTAPSSNTIAGIPIRSWANRVISVLAYFLNPAASTVTVYVPGLTGVKKKVPSPLVCSSLAIVPCDWLSRITLTLGTTAPWLSWTTPLMDPDDCCPNRGAVKTTRATASATPLFPACNFMVNLQTWEQRSVPSPRRAHCFQAVITPPDRVPRSLVQPRFEKLGPERIDLQGRYRSEGEVARRTRGESMVNGAIAARYDTCLEVRENAA